MRHIVLASVLFFAVLPLPLAAAKPLAFEDMMAMRRVGAPEVSPDGKWVAYDVSSIDLEANKRTSAIHLVPSAGGASVKVSAGTRQDENPVWSPDGKQIAWVSNQDDAAKQVYLYDVTKKTSRKLSDLPGGAGTLRWLPDGKGLLLVSDIYPDCGVDAACARSAAEAEAKSPVRARVIEGLLFRHWSSWQAKTRSHIILQNLDGTTKDLTPGPYDSPAFSLGGGEFDVSPDSSELAYVTKRVERPERSTNTEVFIVPLAGGAPKKISEAAGADDEPRYSPDGKWIAFRSQRRDGFESDLWELMLYDRRSGKVSRVLELDAWVSSIDWTPDSRSIVFTIPEKGRSPIYEVAVPRGTAKPLWTEGSASAVTVTKDGRSIFFERASIYAPPEIYAISLNGKALRQVSHENDGLLASIDMGAVSEVYYEGAAGARVQAWMVKPPGFDAAKKYPAIVLIHGGPQGAWGESWSYRWNPQMFAARGYVVFMPNPRGSTGFGQRFLEEISSDWGGKAYDDIMNGVDALAAMPFVDGERIGAAGASYGGYMVNWIAGHSDRFKALVSHAGVYNLESMWGVTEEIWFPEWEFGGAPWEKPEQYEQWSPHRYAKDFRTPTLVSHGELDFRVPIGEAFQFYTTLQRLGVPSKLLYFPDEGHWVLKPQNAKLWHQTVLGWFDQWLKK